MSQLKRSLVFAVAVVAIFGILVVAYHDAIFRWVTLRVLHGIPGMEARIDGRFDVTRFAPFSVDVDGLSIVFKGEELVGARARIGEIHLEARLWRLLRGVVDIQRLRVLDADIELPPSAPEHLRDRFSDKFEVTLINELRLEHVRVRFQAAPSKPTRELNIASLRAGVGEAGALEANAAASLDGDGVELAATLGSIEQLLHPTVPFPVEATLRAPSWGLDAELSGTVAEPLAGRGAEIDVRVTASDIEPLREVFLPDAPFAGGVEAKAQLSGDLHATILSGLALTLVDGERLRVTVAGDVANVQEKKELDLRVEIDSEDPAVTRFLLGGTTPAAQTLRLRGAIRGSDTDYGIDGLDVALTGLNGMSLVAQGTMRFGDLDAAWPVRAARLDLQFAAAAADLKAWLPDAAGESGALRGKAQVEVTADTLTVQNAHVTLEQTQPIRGSLQGQLTYTLDQLKATRAKDGATADVWIPSNFDLSLDLETDDLKTMATRLGDTLPDLGPVSAKGRLRRDGEAIEVTKLDTRTTGKRPLGLAATGQLTIAGVTSAQLRDVELMVEAKGQNAEAAAPIVGTLAIDPGPWSLQARLAGETGRFRVDALEFASGRDDVRVELTGVIPDLGQLRDSAGRSAAGVQIDGHITAASTKQLGALIGRELPSLGRLDASFEARGGQDDWALPKAEVSITSDTGLDIKASGNASRLFNEAGYDLHVTLRVPNPTRTAARAGESIVQIAPISADGQLKGTQKKGSFEGRVAVGSTLVQTDLGYDWAGPRPHVTGTLSTPVIALGDFLGPAAVPSKQDADVASPLLSRQPLGFHWLHHANVDLNLIADKIAGERVRTERLDFTLHIGDGRLKTNHEELRFEGGSISTTLEVDSAVDPPRVHLTGRGNNISLGALHAQVSDEPRLLEGLFSFDIDLTASGDSPHELSATANGRGGHVLENAKLAGRDLDILAFDYMWLLTSTLMSKKHTQIDCAIVKFQMSDGVAKSETLYMRTPKLVAVGTGQLNFADETVDILVNTDKKTGLLSKRAALRIYGPMQDPEVDTDLSAAAIAAVAGASAFALPPVGFSLAGLSFLAGFITDSGDTPCTSE